MNLKKAVLDQMGMDENNLMQEDYQKLSDISNYGAIGGVSGFIMYRTTCQFFDKNRDEIRKQLIEDAENYGQSLCEMVHSFNYFKNFDCTDDEINTILYTTKKTENETTLKNGFAWYACETVTYSMEDEIENALNAEEKEV